MLIKTVNGIPTPMTAEEEAATLAEWEANAAKPSPAKATLVASIIADPEQLAALKAALAK